MCIIICICRWYMFVVILFAILDAESAVNSVLSAFYAHLEIWKSSHIFAQEWLKTMCMTPQKTIYITVYLLLLIPTLSIALVTRIFSLKVMMLDGFSGNIIFLITCILCAVLYLIFKTTIDGYILPLIFLENFSFGLNFSLLKWDSIGWFAFFLVHQFCVNLGCWDVAMSQHFAHRIDVCSGCYL